MGNMKEFKVTLLDVWNLYQINPFTDLLVKTRFDTNDADYVYGMKITTAKEFLLSMIELALRFRDEKPDKYSGDRMIEYYVMERPAYIRGMSEVEESIDIYNLSELQKNMSENIQITELLLDIVGSHFGQTVYDRFDEDSIYDELGDNTRLTTEEKIEQLAYVFFEIMEEDVRKSLVSVNRSLDMNTKHVEELKEGTSDYCVKSGEKAVAARLKYHVEDIIPRYKQRLAEEEAKLLQIEHLKVKFPKVTTDVA